MFSTTSSSQNWKSPQLNQFKQKWRGDLKPSLMLDVTQLVEYVTNGLLWCINFFFLECNYFFLPYFNMFYIMQIWSIFLHLYNVFVNFNWSYVPRSYERKFSDCVNEDWKNSVLQQGLNPCPRDALTSWTMEPREMGYFWVQIMHDHESMDEMIFMKWLIYWTAGMKLNQAMILAVIIYCRGVEKRKIQRFSTQLLKLGS